MPEQLIVTMRHENDCEVAGLATATGKTWEEARGALGWRNLPGPVENPVFGNPANVSRAAAALGWSAVECGLSALLEYRAAPGRVLVLIHDPENPTLAQHWVVWFGGADGHHALAWGDGRMVWRKADVLKDLVTKGKPNSVMELAPIPKKLGFGAWVWRYLTRWMRWR
jgi:hypothetical protein